MKNIIFRWITFFFSVFYGKIALQKFFNILHYIALDGLHYGKVHNLQKDGELWLIRHLNKKLKINRPSITVFDVGANRGDYTRLLLGTFRGLSYNIHLFEPGKEAFGILESKFSQDNLFINNFGLGESSGKILLYIPKDRTDTASIHHQSLSSEKEEVEIYTIDDYCEKNHISKIHLLKLDVEGHEYACLKGAEKMLKNHNVLNIQFEFGKSNIHSRIFFKDIYELLSGMDYDIFRLVKNGLLPIKKYHERLEIFLTTNYFARPRDDRK